MIRSTGQGLELRGNRRRSGGQEEEGELLVAPFIHAVVNLAGIKVKYEISRAQRGVAAPRMYPLPRSHAFSWRKFVPPFSTCKLECMARPRTRKEEGEEGKRGGKKEGERQVTGGWKRLTRSLFSGS